jgi:hypothetical protein
MARRDFQKVTPDGRVDLSQPYVVALKNDWGDPVTQTALRWCYKELGRHGINLDSIYLYSYSLGYGTVNFRFKLKEDALRFKLCLPEGAIVADE